MASGNQEDFNFCPSIKKWDQTKAGDIIVSKIGIAFLATILGRSIIKVPYHDSIQIILMIKNPAFTAQAPSITNAHTHPESK